MEGFQGTGGRVVKVKRPGHFTSSFVLFFVVVWGWGLNPGHHRL